MVCADVAVQLTVGFEAERLGAKAARPIPLFGGADPQFRLVSTA